MPFNTLAAISEPDTSECLFSCLKPREWKVLVLLIDDFTNDEIMLALNIKRRTVINVRSAIGDKLNLKGAHTLALFCRKNRDSILSRYNLYRLKK